MKIICEDNNIFYYILNAKKITMITEIIVILFVLFMIISIIIKKKKKKTIKIKTIITTILLGVLGLFCVGINIFSYYIHHFSEYNLCLEEEERTAIESSPIEMPEYVEKEKEETTDDDYEETIEIVEGKIEQEETNKENAIYFLNVGAGSDAFIIQDDGHFGLIDTGYNSKANYIVKQLKKLGVESLDFIILTHAHMDHIGGYKKIISKIPTETLYIKNPGNVNSAYLVTYHDLIKVSEEKGITICDVKEELCQSIKLGNTIIDLFNTDFITAKGVEEENRSRIENTNSIVALATINHKKIYFASDIGDYFEYAKETELAKEIGDIDVYKASHHGYISFNNNLVALSYLKPEYTIITNTKDQSLKTLNRIKNTSPDYQKTYYTPDGTITLHVTMDGRLEFNQLGE